MENNGIQTNPVPDSGQQPASFFNKKNLPIWLLVIGLTLLAYFLNSGMFFRASILDLSQVPPFDGTHLPVKQALKWTSLSSQQFADFKSGALTYDTAGSLLIPLPTYDAALYCNTDPTKLGWSGTDLDKRNSFLTFVTVNLGKYTSGAGRACEGEGSHPAVDIRSVKLAPVYNIANGMVSKVKSDSSNGNVVCITHPNVPSLENTAIKVTYISCHLHLDSISSGIKEGLVVTKGQQIGVVGKTGTATTFHNHFQLDKQEAPFHPYWPFSLAECQAQGGSFFSCVDLGVGKDKAALYTVNPMKWVQANLTFGQTVTAGTGDTTVTTTVTTTNTSGQNTNSSVANSNTNTNRNTNSVPSVTNQNSNGTVSTTTVVTTVTTTTGGNPFSDVTAGYPYSAAIKYLKDNNVVAGNPDGTFQPESAINRAAFTKIVMEANHKGQAQGGNCFSDVTDQWFAPYVCAAKAKGIVGGYPDGTFRPDNNVTFVEASKIISVGLGYSSADSPTTIWYKMFVDILAAKKGIPTSIASFEQQITRGEMSEIIWRLLATKTDKPTQTYTSLGGIE